MKNSPEPRADHDEDTSARRRVLLASPRGYCAGVERAVRTVEIALSHYGPPVYVRRQIVHNGFVVRSLEQRGAVFVDELSDVPEGATAVFSAHGVAPAVREEAGERDLRVIDATCPLVTKVHNEARRFARRDLDILLIGHRDHEEIVGTMGEAPENTYLVEDVRGAATVRVRDPERVVWLSQTTLSVSETHEVVGALRTRFPRLADPPSDDICYATQNRQLAVRDIAPRVQLLIVVGSRNSSNSRRLVEVALEAGAPSAYLVDDERDLEPAWFAGDVRAIGLTSGASVPEVLVRRVLRALGEQGFTDVEEVESISEAMTFALPQELRQVPDQAAGGSHAQPWR